MEYTKLSEVIIKVKEADPSLVGRNIITLDSTSKERLRLTSGDFVSIKGRKETVAQIWPTRPQDDAESFIRMDSLIRLNTGVAIGDTVVVKKAAVKEAHKIYLAPTQNVKLPPNNNFARVAKKQYLGKALNTGDQLFLSLFGNAMVYAVAKTNPTGFVYVSDSTLFELLETPITLESASISKIGYNEIGGLGKQLSKVRELVELPLKHPEIFRTMGIAPPKGILFFGPPGTGKTLLARAIANETNANFSIINGPSIMSKYVGGAEEKIRTIFKEAQENAPAIIFIDEIDAIASNRDDSESEVGRRVVGQLLSVMDGLEARGDIIIIAATNRPNSLDPALRRPGRFDREIHINAPDKNGRFEVFNIHTKGVPLGKDVDLKELARITHGFVGADINALVKEAAMQAIRRILPKIDMEEETIPSDILESIEISMLDFSKALQEVQPSALREVMVEVPNVTWVDIGGLEEVKEQLKKSVEWPLQHADSFRKMGIDPIKGVLLYGPPGTGKTMLAKAIANESEANFISVRGPEVFSKWVGDSEKTIREIFTKARQTSPCVIFFDEIDALAPKRDQMADGGVSARLVNQLLVELDGLSELKGVVLIAATNRPDIIDPALLRPGRFDNIIFVPAPDLKSREEIIKKIITRMPLSKEGQTFIETLAEKTDGYSGADLNSLLREAALIALERSRMKDTQVTDEDVKAALKKTKPSLTKDVIDTYRKFEKNVGV
ncbi:MAG: CDC48 family AAA ATPase [Candidatus ainarchaeum sp.]|nr:CDC48 family AAA ATPase [Candidatus ainarchaeum sp.]